MGRPWALSSGFVLPGKLAGGEGGGAAPHKPGTARRLGLPGSLAPRRRQTHRPRPVEPQRHHAAAWRTAAQDSGRRTRAPSLNWPRVGSGARPGPAKLSLRAPRQEPADGHQLSRQATQPRSGLEPAAPEDAPGLLLQSQTRPTPLLQQLTPSEKGLLPRKSGVRGKGRSDGQQDCRSHHPGLHGGTHSNASGIQPQACETGHWYT